MDAPGVSVVMSVYNGQEFLREAIESILRQSYGDFEFVIIDDGSTDRTAEILAEYAGRDARIRLQRHENKGRAVSLNIGIELARAPYIARMDADDVSASERLRRQVDYMRDHPDTVMVGSWAQVIDLEGAVMAHCHVPPTGGIQLYAALCTPRPRPFLQLRVIQ